MFFFSLPPDTRRESEMNTEQRSVVCTWSTATNVIALPQCPSQTMQAIVGLHQTESTYALVEVDGVFAGDDIGDGAAAGLAGGLLAALC